MKKLLCASLFFVSSTVLSEAFSLTGYVDVIGINSFDLWGEDTSYFMLDSSMTAGACKKSGDKVLIRVLGDKGGDRQLSMLMSAQMANKKIIASLDDNRIDSGGYCIVRWIQLKK